MKCAGSLLILWTVLFTSCSMSTPVYSIKTTGRVPLPELPSGSALCLYGNTVWAVSDNATAVYRCDTSFRRFERIPLEGFGDYENIVPKPQKHDLEAAVIADKDGSPCLLAFGSGSLSPQRDRLLVLPLATPGQQAFIPLGDFYAQLRAQAGIAAEAFNIEAAMIANGQLYLMDRGTNTVFRMKADDFLRWTDGAAALPAVLHSRLVLPGIGKRSAGFSGACRLDETHVLFCASVEDTDDWIADGEVLGSFIGILDTGREGMPVLQQVMPVPAFEGCTDKLEGLLVLPGDKERHWDIIALADNDDKGSVLLRLELVPQ